MREKIRKAIEFIANPRLLLCYCLAWMITNGWSYALLSVGTFCNIPWMTAISGTYLAVLWFPIVPEQIVTIALTIVLLRVFFPNDEKTVGEMNKMREKIKEKLKKKKK